MAVRVENGGEPIPGYRLLERLGGGGFGEVWKAEAPGGIFKAIKFVFGNLESSGEDEVRARQELKALNRVKTVRHPYILSLERYDIIDGQLLIVMELADRNLWDRFKECRSQGLPGIPRDELMRYMEECAEALDLMNEQYQLQHLDIKPQNLFLVYNHVKVADFGLVKDLEGMRAVITGGITPVYAAPETFDGEVTRFCDQYSLAIVYQELLTGRRPFTGVNVQQLILQHLTAAPVLDPLPAGDRDAIARSLAKKPDDRFPSCFELVKALKGSTEGAASLANAVPVAEEAKPTPPPYISPRTPVSPLPEAAAAVQSAPPTANLRMAPRTEENARPPLPEEHSQPRRPAPEEKVGEGLLLPAVVVGVGGLGMLVLQRLREELSLRAGPPGHHPHIRLVYLDTDADAAREATQGRPEAVLSQNEIVLARLNRPVHYLKPVPGRIRVDSWLDPKLIYRIPRQLVTTGVRALGRLALMDNYRAIVNRLQTEIETAASPDSLDTALQKTKLGLRTNRPRVYVVANLAGGTGSGMCLDLGYLVRQALRQFGYDRPDVVALLFLPKPDGGSARSVLAAANAYAALTEIHHFAAADTLFTAHYDDNDPPVKDRAPPWTRCVLLPLPVETNDPTPTRRTACLAADFLCRELVTPLGVALDRGRKNAHDSRADGGMACQTFGLFRYFWPRRLLVRRTARFFLQCLVKTWIGKDRAPVREDIAVRVAEEWEQLDLAPERFIPQLQDACLRQLSQPPEGAFAALLAPLETAAKPTSSFLFRRTPDLDAREVSTALEKLEQLVGRPESGTTTGQRRAAVLVDFLPEAAKPLFAEFEKKLVGFALRLLEKPGFRLAGAEEAIAQIHARLAQVIGHQEEMVGDLTRRSTDAHNRLRELIVHLQMAGGRRTGALTPDIMEQLRSYPKWRYQLLVLRQVVQSCRKLQSRLGDILREVGFCRERLTELLRAFEQPIARSEAETSGGYGQGLLPGACDTFDEAVERILAEIPEDDLQVLEERSQTLIKQQFGTLRHVCQSSGTLMKNLEAALQAEAEAMAHGRMKESDVAQMFFQRFPQDIEARTNLAAAFEDAYPELGRLQTNPGIEISYVGLSPGPDSERFIALVREALNDEEIETVPNTDDIVFFREIAHLPLAGLEQLGPAAREHYEHLQVTQDLTPHSRTDLTDWQPVPTR